MYGDVPTLNDSMNTRWGHSVYSSANSVDAIDDACSTLAVVCVAAMFVMVVLSFVRDAKNLVALVGKSAGQIGYVAWNIVLSQCPYNLEGRSAIEERDRGDVVASSIQIESTSQKRAPAHGVTHLGVIMDGNRRYGQRKNILLGDQREPREVPSSEGSSVLKGHPLSSNNNDETVTEIAALCNRVCFVDENLCESKVGESAYSEWIQAQYAALLGLLRHSALNGHRLGGEKLIEFIGYCIDEGIDMLTVYAFSTENWNRPAHEVNVLMALFFFFFEQMRTTARTNGIFIRFVSSEPERLPPRVLHLMREVESETRALHPRRIVVNVCVSYSGQSEVVAACNRIVAARVHSAAGASPGDNCSDNEKPPALVTRHEFENQLLRSLTQGVDDADDCGAFSDRVPREPQLLLRTSGEHRLSNFLLYEAAYTEFYFTQKMWPEVEREDLQKALGDYARRGRRIGR